MNEWVIAGSALTKHFTASTNIILSSFPVLLISNFFTLRNRLKNSLQNFMFTFGLPSLQIDLHSMEFSDFFIQLFTNFGKLFFGILQNYLRFIMLDFWHILPNALQLLAHFFVILLPITIFIWFLALVVEIIKLFCVCGEIGVKSPVFALILLQEWFRSYFFWVVKVFVHYSKFYRIIK